MSSTTLQTQTQTCTNSRSNPKLSQTCRNRCTPCVIYTSRVESGRLQNRPQNRPSPSPAPPDTTTPPTAAPKRTSTAPHLELQNLERRRPQLLHLPNHSRRLGRRPTLVIQALSPVLPPSLGEPLCKIPKTASRRTVHSNGELCRRRTHTPDALRLAIMNRRQCGNGGSLPFWEGEK